MEALNIEIIRNTKEVFTAELNILFRKLESESLSYALGGAKDNPEMESFFSRLEAEGHSPFLDAQDINELKVVVDSQMHYYNTERRHSSIGYLSPMMYVRQVWSNDEEELPVVRQ